MTIEKPSIKEIFDALTGSSLDGCHPDWCREILERASPEDVAKVEKVLAEGLPLSEAAYKLGIRN